MDRIRINGHNSYADLKDVLTQMPTRRASEIDQLLSNLLVRALTYARRIGCALTILMPRTLTKMTSLM